MDSSLIAATRSRDMATPEKKKNMAAKKFLILSLYGLEKRENS